MELFSSNDQDSENYQGGCEGYSGIEEGKVENLKRPIEGGDISKWVKKRKITC